jgi:hypothetical protein
VDADREARRYCSLLKCDCRFVGDWRLVIDDSPG